MSQEVKKDGQQTNSGGSETKESDPAASDSCPLCAGKISLRILGPCVHPLCHKCGIKLRALYENMECPFCKTEMPLTVLTRSKDKTYAELVNRPMRLDKKTGIYMDGNKSQQEFDNLLNFTCPSSNCSFVATNGWPEIKKHVKTAHRRSFCNVCLGVQKKFCKEFNIYTTTSLSVHMEYGDKDDPTTRGHPACKFCSTRYYDSEYLSKHMKRSHEECFICAHSGTHPEEYHRDYNALERHFYKEHFICNRQECLERKFVVYATKKGLNDHTREAHSGTFSGASHNKEKPIVTGLAQRPKNRNNTLFELNPSSGSSIPASRAMKMLPASFSRQSKGGAISLLSSSENQNSSSDNTHGDPAASHPKPQPNDAVSENLPPKHKKIQPADSLSQEVIDEAFNTLTAYQQDLVRSTFSANTAMHRLFAENFAKFHLNIIGAVSFAEAIINILVSKFNGEQLKNKIEDTSFLIKNIASVASSVHRNSKLCVGNILVESWNSQAAELLRSLPPTGGADGTEGAMKGSLKLTDKNSTTIDMFPSLPQSDACPSVTLSAKGANAKTFSSAVKRAALSSPAASFTAIHTAPSAIVSTTALLKNKAAQGYTSQTPRNPAMPVVSHATQQKKVEFPPLPKNSSGSPQSAPRPSKPAWPRTNVFTPSASTSSAYGSSKRDAGSRSKEEKFIIF